MFMFKILRPCTATKFTKNSEALLYLSIDHPLFPQVETKHQ
jgi:hypothetical protein